MIDPVPPSWLALLRAARYAHGQPTIRDIATKAGLQPGVVSSILRSRTKPSNANILISIMDAVECTFEEVTQILEAFSDPPVLPPLEFRTDVQIITDAINNLADAVRSLKGVP